MLLIFKFMMLGVGIGLLAIGSAETVANPQPQDPPHGFFDNHLHGTSAELADVLRTSCMEDGGQCDSLFYSPVYAEQIQSLLDDAGFTGSTMISGGYLYGWQTPVASSARRLLRAENKFVLEQTASYPNIFPVMSVSLNIDGAEEEIEYWAEHGNFVAVKMHMGSDQFAFDNDGTIETCKGIMSAVAAAQMGLIIHIRYNDTFGEDEIDMFLNEILPEESKIPIQIAHAGGWGSGFDAGTRRILEIFRDRIRAGANGTQMLQFDLVAVVRRDNTQEQAVHLAAIMREVGLGRFLIGTDYPSGWRPGMLEQLYRAKSALTPDELEQVMQNRAWYLPLQAD